MKLQKMSPGLDITVLQCVAPPGSLDSYTACFLAATLIGELNKVIPRLWKMPVPNELVIFRDLLVHMWWAMVFCGLWSVLHSVIFGLFLQPYMGCYTSFFAAYCDLLYFMHCTVFVIPVSINLYT